MELISSGDYDSAYALLEEISDKEAIASNKYDRAIKYIDSGDYDSAYELLEEIGDKKTIDSSKYDRAIKYLDSGDYKVAYQLLEEIDDKETIASSKYDRAIKYIDSGDYKAASMLLNGLSYKDSAKRFQSVMRAQIKKAKVGDIVYFGTYEQDNNTSNGKEDIAWLVLTKESNRVFVISDKSLDCQQYGYKTDRSVTWETCSLRNWLNNDFINAAFSDDEKAMIPMVTVSADKNPKYDTDPGNATKDRIFLLSAVETKKYFASDEARKCVPTKYAISNGAFTNNKYTKGGAATCIWWMRSLGYNDRLVVKVCIDGSIDETGDPFYRDCVAVRPAMWITIDG